MNKPRSASVIAGIALVLIVQWLRAQGGSLPPVPVSSQIAPVPRVRPPLTVLNKPIVAQFELARRQRSGEGAAVPGDFRLKGKFCRDRNGSTRTDYFDLDPGASANSIAVSIIWSAENKTTNILSFAERAVQEIQGPPMSPREDAWTPNGRFAVKFTNEQRTIQGVECKRVSLLPISSLPGRGQLTETLQGETWVALDWGIVMLDVMETSTEELRWEVVRVDRTEPDPCVFAIPEGFTIKQ